MKCFNNRMIFVVSGILVISTARVSAISELDINNNSLAFYVSKYSVVKELESFLKENSIESSEYRMYITSAKKYRYSREAKWESIENGVAFIDPLLFVTEEMKKESEERFKIEKDGLKVYESIKKDLINNPEYVLELIQRVQKDEKKMKEAFKLKYERPPTKKELAWLMDETTIKYALYGGEMGREISDREYLLIKQGGGYNFFALSKEDVEDYAEYVMLRDRITPLEKRYYSVIDVYASIHERIYSEYKVDLYRSLTEGERLQIHSKSVDGIVFNEGKAYALVEKLLKKKGLIDDQNQDDSLDEGDSSEDDSINQDSSSSNPNNELNQHISKNNSSIRDALLSNIKNLYKTQKIEHSSNLRNTYIHFKYKNTRVNTYVRPHIDGILSIDQLKQIFNKINDELKSKIVFDSKEILLFVESLVKTNSMEMKKEMPLGDLAFGMKGVGIYLYEEDMLNESEIEMGKENNVTENPYLQVDLDGESYSVPCDEDARIGNGELKKLMELMGMKYIFTTDTVLVLKEGCVYSVEVSAYNNGFVTAEEVKDILKGVGVEAAIKIINRREM